MLFYSVSPPPVCSHRSGNEVYGCGEQRGAELHPGGAAPDAALRTDHVRGGAPGWEARIRVCPQGQRRQSQQSREGKRLRRGVLMPQGADSGVLQYCQNQPSKVVVLAVNLFQKEVMILKDLVDIVHQISCLVKSTMGFSLE